jgi:predicted pyridoxine 5'-phosphate oxidase superfamily flavin-nucleotide-binding protein
VNAQDDESLGLSRLRNCFEGVIPAVIATASTDGTPNVTYLSRVCLVDDERVALSNQFFSKTMRNLAENPRASLILIDPTTYDDYRLSLVYERTDRRGPVFDRLREDVDRIAAIQHMQDVFKLRAADIYRVVDIERRVTAVPRGAVPEATRSERRDTTPDVLRVAELTGRLARCQDLDALVDTTLGGLAELFGYEHSLLLLLDERGTRLYTIASYGYDAEGIGSEVVVGDGLVGMAAMRCSPLTVGNLHQMTKYSRTVRREYEDHGQIEPGRDIPVPGLADADSQIAVPVVALGELIGVLLVESVDALAFGPLDQATLSAVAALVANAIELDRARERAADVAPAEETEPAGAPAPVTAETEVRFFAVDGSTFVDGDYLIKGVAGRILWALLRHHAADGRTDFTNREMRLDPTLELPDFRDNFESRLILLKRRLDEREAPIRIEKSGRGRFRLVVDRPVRLEAAHGAA